jgi:hypothetical protein
MLYPVMLKSILIMLVILLVAIAVRSFQAPGNKKLNRHGGYPTSTVHNDPSHFRGRNRPIPVREHNPLCRGLLGLGGLPCIQN